MHSVQTYIGNCTKIIINGYEISVAFERSDLTPPTKEFGEIYNRVGIKVFKADGDDDYTEKVFGDGEVEVYGCVENLLTAIQWCKEGL